MPLLGEEKHVLPACRRVATRLSRQVRRAESVNLDGIRLQLGEWATPEIRDGIYSGWYEARERAVVSRTLRPDDVVLELGTGIGYLTTIAAGIAREVRSFDANPAIVEVARRTLALNGRSAVVENAIVERSPSAATVPFYVSSEFWASSMTPADACRRVDVPVLDMIETCAGCSYLIIDIEGREVVVLDGELPGIRAICVECHPDLTTPRQISDMLVALFGQGFALDLQISREAILYLEREKWG